MSLTNLTTKTPYAGNGVTTVFPFTFKVFDPTHLVVTETTAAGVTTTLVLNTDYTVTGVGLDAGGSITRASAPPTGTTGLIRRVMPLTQTADIRNQSAFYAAVHEDVFDRLTMIDQQQEEEIGRSVQLPEQFSAGVSTQLPQPASGAAIGWDGTGQNLVNLIVSGAPIGLPNGAASLDGSGLVPLSQLVASHVQFTQAGAGAVAETVDAKLKQVVSPKDFGAVSDGVTNDSTAVTNALATVPLAGSLTLPQGQTFVGTARLTNQRGVQLPGGLLEYTPSSVLGNRVQNAAGRDRVAWGSEYLYEFLSKFVAGTATTIRLSGDSTTANTGQYSDQLITMLQKFPSVTVTKAGFSGKNTADWVSTYLAGDIAAAADVLIWHWGMNDSAAMGQTMTQFEANLRSGLTTYRASIPIGSGSIILMAPNASSDGTNGRDELRNEQMRQIIRNAAADFQCAYLDTYALFQDGYVGIGNWIDNPYGDGLRGIHPQTAFAQSIAGEVLDLLIPPGVRRLAGEFGVSNSFGSTNPLTTDLPTTYPYGVSIRRATAANGWPVDGWVLTFFENTNKTYALQINFPYNTVVQPQTRTYVLGAWQSFYSLVGFAGSTAMISKTGSTVQFQSDGSAGNARGFAASTSGNRRMDLMVDGTSETGSDAGSNIIWRAYSDAGSVIDTFISTVRASGGAITLGGSTKRPVVPTGYVGSATGTAVASASTITPTGQIFHITGTTTVNTINLPYTGFTGTIRIIPDGAFTTGTSGNIALASTAVVGRVLEMTYDGTKWYPSY